MATLASGPINTTDTVRSTPDGTPLPPGIYTGIVTKTAQKDTNDRTGVFVEVEFDITAPQEQVGRKFWDRFNIVNASADATRIGKEALADLGLAAGYPVLEDDEQLMGREVIMEIYIAPAKPYVDKKTGQQRDGKPQNQCKKYWPVGTDVENAKKAQKGQQAAAPAAQATPAQATNRWPTTAAAKPAAAPAQAQQQAPQPAAQPQSQAQAPAPAAAAPAGPATNMAPWKRNKQ